MAHDTDRYCPCVSDHRPDPLELHEHHLMPVYLGGDKDGPTVFLCPTAHVNTHELLRSMLKEGELTWRQVLDMNSRPVSRHAYQLALHAYRQWTQTAP